MIVLIENVYAKSIIKRYLYDNINDFILRVLGIYSFTTVEDKKYYLLSFDYVKDNRELSFITLQFNDSKNTCKCDLCHNNVNKVLVFKDRYNTWSDDVFTNVCSKCITKKSGFKISDSQNCRVEFFKNELKRALLIQELVSHNKQDLLDKVLADLDNKNIINYHGCNIRKIVIQNRNCYFVGINDVFIINTLTKQYTKIEKGLETSLEKPSTNRVHISSEQDMYLINYFHLLRLFGTDFDRIMCFSQLLRHYIISDLIYSLARAPALLEDLNKYLKINESIIKNNNMRAVTKITQDAPFVLNMDSIGCASSVVSKGNYAVRDDNSQQNKELYLLGNIGDYYKNAKVKLVKIKKNNRDFFKGRYKNLYRLYFGYYRLLWNTDIELTDGNYICNFKIYKHVITKNEVCTIITNCRTKQLV